MIRSHWLHEPLAIIGMDCRLPGADGLREFWQLLVDGKSAIDRLPDERLNRRLYFDSEKGKRGKTYSDVGGVVDDRSIDWKLLNIPASDGDDWDPCHLALCEVAARACQDAGYDPRNVPIKNTGVFIGHSGGTTLGGDRAFRCMVDDYLEILEGLPQWSELGSPDLMAKLRAKLVAHRRKRENGLPHVDASFASGLICRNFGFIGPHLSIDAACASSLVALSMASLSLASGQVDMAIVGGASYNKADSLVLFSAAQSCSAGMSRPFDDHADGLISSEGYVTLVVKRLSRAVEDGDNIRAVIRGIGISSDGRGRSLWAPRHEGQLAAIQRAYPSDIQPESVQLIEAHATSTQLGDATELTALAGFYKPCMHEGQRIAIGSVKSNIGHTLETAGLAGLVKVVLAIKNRVIPPSINLQVPNRTINWQELPFYVPTKSEVWQTDNVKQPRRAAVNAFGIGGLNVHVVVDEACAAEPRSADLRQPILLSDQKSSVNVNVAPIESRGLEPLAVIGRGLIVPGANCLEDFRVLLSEDKSSSKSPISALNLCHRVDFKYDWKKHKIPPKQLARANPLQFMLLEAAEQALDEAGLLSNRLDTSRTVVLVGSIFGGDFGNSLFAGLRLPEIRDHLRSLLSTVGVSSGNIQELAESFEARFLEKYPALLDETGSFTSSTLASRIAKTFNLMGGALAIDAGDISGLAALQAASWLLNSGSVTTAICAAAQSALDGAALENLAQCGRLPNADTQTGYEIGEGVAVLVLKTLGQAQRDGDTIHAKVEMCGARYAGNDPTTLLHAGLTASAKGIANSPLSSIDSVVGRLGIPSLDTPIHKAIQNYSLSGPPVPFLPSENLFKTGQLQGAQGILDVIACSLENANRRRLVIGHAQSGQIAVAQVSSSPSEPAALKSELTRVTSNAPQSTELVSADWLRSLGLHVGCWGADSLEDLKFSLLKNPPKEDLSLVATHRFQGFVVATHDQNGHRSKKLASLLQAQVSQELLMDQGMGWVDRQALHARPLRLAFLFSGQGSQYANMLAGITELFPSTRRILESADKALKDLKQPSFAQMAWTGNYQLGEDIWVTQAALLVADLLLYYAVRDLGLNPEIVCGHSYGEIPALVASGSLDLANALRMTWSRCQSVADYGQSSCSMLSVQASANQVTHLLNQHTVNATISHFNAPQQTVVGGLSDEVKRFENVLLELGINCRLLNVPTAFHTPALDQSVQPFFDALQPIQLEIPKKPFLSGVNNRFVADPAELKIGLSRQLITPVHFGEMLDRLSEVGVTHLIEIGPRDALTRLARLNETCMQVFSSDPGPKKSQGPEQWIPLLSLHLFGRIHGLTQSQSNHPGPVEMRSVARIPNRELHPIVKYFDATQVRRQRLKLLSESNASRDDLAHKRVVDLLKYQPIGITEPSRFVDTKQKDPGARLDSSVTQQNSNDPTSVKDDEKNRLQSRRHVEQLLVDFVVEQTGYPAEIVDLKADMEADLGIDSIKKAQLLGELGELFPEIVAKLKSSHSGATGSGNLTGNRLDQFRTLEDFVLLFSHSTPQASDTDAARQETGSIPTASKSATGGGPNNNTRVSNEPMASQSVSADHRARIEQHLIDFVIEHTGYPREIVELDADIEADLGIDSIKKAQLLGEMRETFSIELEGGESESPQTRLVNKSLNLDSLRTLRQILDILSPQKPSSLSVEPQNDRQPLLASRKQECVAEHDKQDWKDVARKNLHSLARCSLPMDSNQITSPWLYSSSVELSKSLCVSKEAVIAFSNVCLSESDWDLMPCGDYDATSENCWLFALRLPTCISESGVQPVTVVQSDFSASHKIVIPGSAAAFAVVNRHNLLLVVGSNSIQARVSLAEWLECLEDANLEEIRKQVDEVGELADWWLVVVDPLEKELTQFSVGVSGVTEDTKGLQSWAGDLDYSRPSWAFIGFDCQTHRWLLGIRDRSLLEIPRVIPISCPFPTQYYSGFAEPHHDERQIDAVELSKAHASRGNENSSQSNRSSNSKVATHSSPTRVAQRYILRMVDSPQVELDCYKPVWAGAAIVVGDNPIATSLIERLERSSVKVLHLSTQTCQSEHGFVDQFKAACEIDKFPHLFIVSPCDAAAQINLDGAAWEERSRCGLMGIYWLCQAWLQHATQEKLMDDASLFAVSSLGGDFGLGGGVFSTEGGGLDGLLKSMLIESWMQGYRNLSIKTLDTYQSQEPESVVDGIYRELAVPSYDCEISYSHGKRQVLRAIPSPVPERASKVAAASSVIRRGGTWVCSGGARGITAFAVERLAQRYGLTVHLIGTTPIATQIPQQSDLDSQGIRELKLSVMMQAREAGSNPVKAWQLVEKQMEIAETLSRFQRLGIEAYYHACNIADRQQLNQVLQNIRSQSGPIHGVIHGAGIGRDSRFDRKQPEHVRQCIQAKVDGTLALMSATWDDPLQAFVGFGSISGRFGANGHTDYSLANEMLSKLIDWYKARRPEVRAVGFHWHAWGDIGMAIKPETRLALEMIQMQMMPANEGVEHLIDELESESQETEVLITDDRYYRAFYPAEILDNSQCDPVSAGIETPLLEPEISKMLPSVPRVWTAKLDPTSDPFLTDHLLSGRPLLPFVIATEMLFEAGSAEWNTNQICLTDIMAMRAIKFFTDAPAKLRLESRWISDRSAVSLELFSNVVTRSGRIVEENRLSYRAQASQCEPSDLSNTRSHGNVLLTSARNLDWKSVKYPEAGGEFYLGWPLQKLRKYCLVADGLVGRINAPATIELAGVTRNTVGWALPSATLDACFFATGLLAWHRIAPGTALPTEIGQLRLLRSPRAGEACQVHVAVRSTSDHSATFDFSLYGVDNSLLLDVVGYRVEWLSRSISSVPAGLTDKMESR